MRWALGVLAASGVDSPRMDAELLMARTLRCDRAGVQTHWHDPLDADNADQFRTLVRRRAGREPLAYILGERCFYDVTLLVSPAVLVPRPETEHLVEAALAWAQKRERSRLGIVDVGTGSGAIAIVLARHLAQSRVIATDVSAAALEVARCNATRLRVAHRLTLTEADLLNGFCGAFDLIVANLPYVDSDELPILMPEVSQHEPRVALDGGPGGLRTVSRLLAQLPSRLASGGLSLLELDPRQFERASAMARHYLPEAHISSLSDLAGHDRVLRIERPSDRCP